MRVLGLDPSLRNFGWAVGDVDPISGFLTVDKIGLIETEKGKQTKTVRQTSDDLVRCRIIFNGLQEILKGVDLVCAEMPHGSQSASAAKSKGVCIMAIATIKQPVIQLSERDVKMATIGRPSATKRESIDYATGLYPDLNWFSGKGQKYGNANEHPADAIGAILAGIQTDEFRLASAMMMSKAA